MVFNTALQFICLLLNLFSVSMHRANPSIYPTWLKLLALFGVAWCGGWFIYYGIKLIG